MSKCECECWHVMRIRSSRLRSLLHGNLLIYICFQFISLPPLNMACFHFMPASSWSTFVCSTHLMLHARQIPFNSVKLQMIIYGIGSDDEKREESDPLPTSNWKRNHVTSLTNVKEKELMATQSWLVIGICFTWVTFLFCRTKCKKKTHNFNKENYGCNINVFLLTSFHCWHWRFLYGGVKEIVIEIHFEMAIKRKLKII